MSTRGTVVINNREGERQIAIYQHSDSYIHRGLGAILFKFMENRVLVNGISVNGWKGRKIQVNGLGDLGAQLVAELKGDSSNVGGIYIMTEGEEIHGDVEYIYYITPTAAVLCPYCGRHGNSGDWEIKIVRHKALIFTGTPEKAMDYFGRNKSKPLY